MQSDDLSSNLIHKETYPNQWIDSLFMGITEKRLLTAVVLHKSNQIVGMTTPVTIDTDALATKPIETLQDRNITQLAEEGSYTAMIHLSVLLIEGFIKT